MGLGDGCGSCIISLHYHALLINILVETRVGKNMSTTFVVCNICSSFSELDSYLQ